MTGGGPDMAAITSSLERSLRLSEDSSHSLSLSSLDLNSQISLPYHWEQCLDLKTGEVYYRNWRTGIKAKDDPRTTGDFYSEEEEDEDEDDEEDDDSSYDDSEESSSESSPISYSSYHQLYQHDHHNTNNKSGVDNNNNNKRENVLVVAGCKSCLMYFMVPKQDSVCSKCCGQLLHFDQPENGSV